MGKKKQTWFERLTDNMRDAFFEAHNEQDNPRSVVASVDFADGSHIEIELYKDNSIDSYYYHADENVDRDCPNITGYIEDNLADWDAMKDQYDDAWPEDEWQAHGFRNEADYWRYRMGS